MRGISKLFQRGKDEILTSLLQYVRKSKMWLLETEEREEEQ